MSVQPGRDSGAEFEVRALAIARAIYDPSGMQGAVMFRGREHDAVFIDDRSVVAFEFTTHRAKEKAQKDASKIRDMLSELGRRSENRFKSLLGFVVTADEPTAEQRGAVNEIAKRSGISVKILSVLTLRSQLIDSERYLALRMDAPFGSTGYRLTVATEGAEIRSQYVEPTLKSADGESISLGGLVGRLAAGSRMIVTADFGAGKSEALKQAFLQLRKLYFKSPTDNLLPVHINLRDCHGLRSPREVLRRHAEELGFPQESSLVAAWRSGNCLLILDGFDELVPTRWVGGARDLGAVRWRALEAVRVLIEETPDGCGVLLAGRPQFFADDHELARTIGLDGDPVVRLMDLDDRQVEKLTSRPASTLPEWVPTRPLMLKFMLESGLLDSVESTLDPASSWRGMLGMIAQREASRVASVTPESVRALIGRVATLARAGEGGLGPISLDDMRSAFRDVCGYEADEEGMQLLLRLPGLASVDSRINGSESRTFIDASLAAAAYGEDLGSYIAAPFEPHPLAEGVTWTSASASLGPAVAALQLLEAGFDNRIPGAVIKRRLDASLFDAVLLDIVSVAEVMASPPNVAITPFFSELLISELVLSEEVGYLASSTFKDCIIERLVIREVASPDSMPAFQSCIIGLVDGWSQLPAEVENSFVDTDIREFSAHSETTDGILSLSLPDEDKVALIVLKKVYAQSGSGRRESSLLRGLPPNLRGSVNAVVDQLVSAGFVGRASGKFKEPLVVPVKGARSAAMGYLSAPQRFSLSSAEVG